MKRLLGVAAAAMVSACGGGGGGGGETSTAPAPLSTTQRNFEATTMSDSYVTFEWYLPNTDVAPVAGTDYFLYSENRSASSPASGPVMNQVDDVNLAATLSMPPATQRSVSRVLKNGTIYVVNESSRQKWSYAGNDVVLTTLATDGVTEAFASEYDDWSAPIPLTGTIASATALDPFLWFLRSNEPLNFDFTKTWLPGASYFTRKGFEQSAVLFLFDWGTRTSDANVTPFPGPATTLEQMFADPGFVGGVQVDHVSYTIESGTISTLQGARVWVANTPRPTSVAPTTSYVVFVELRGAIYYGSMRKAGARLNVIDGVDSTIVDDHTVRLNSRAAQSIRQAVRF